MIPLTLNSLLCVVALQQSIISAPLVFFFVFFSGPSTITPLPSQRSRPSIRLQQLAKIRVGTTKVSKFQSCRVSGDRSIESVPVFLVAAEKMRRQR